MQEILLRFLTCIIVSNLSVIKKPYEVGAIYRGEEVYGG